MFVILLAPLIILTIPMVALKKLSRYNVMLSHGHSLRALWTFLTDFHLAPHQYHRKPRKKWNSGVMAGSSNTKNTSEKATETEESSRFDPTAIGWRDFEKGEPLLALIEVPQVLREKWITGWLAAYENRLWELDDPPKWSAYHPDYQP